MEVVIFILAAIGLTHIFVDSKLLEPFRDLAKAWLPESISYAFSCYQCSGVYLGVVCGWLIFKDFSWWQLAACGFAGSFLASFGNVLMNYLEAQTLIHLGETDGEV